jgi:hypothetical protein
MFWPCLILCVLAVSLASVRPAHAEFRAAAARRVVTPEPLLPVTSGAGPCRPAREKHMDLELRALVAENGGVRVAIVSAPFLGFPDYLCEQVRERVQAVPPDNIIIGATHTHTAPDPYGFPDENGEYGVDAGYLRGVCAQAADAIDEAAAGLRPAVLKTATGEPQGKIAYNYYAPELYDRRCHVVQCAGTDGAPIATLVNYAIHPEILLHREVCSPDLVGPLYACLEEQGGGTALFMNSAQGGMVTADIRTPEGDKEAWSECERIGALLAAEALRIVKGAAPQADPVVACAMQPLRFPVKPVMGQMLMMLSPDTRPWNEPPEELVSRQHLVTLGDARALTIPGEALPNIGFYLKRHMAARHNLLFGLTNDAFGYLMTSVDYDSFPIYEYITQTCLHERAGDALIEQSLTFLARGH